MTGNGALIILMGFLFLFLGYMGVPVAFALIASVLVVTAFTPVSEASMIAQLFNGMDVEALLAVPFFLLGRRLDDIGERDYAHDYIIPNNGWAFARRSRAGRNLVQHVLCRHLRLLGG